MNITQHRCPFYLLKITKNDLAEIKSKKSNTKEILNYYQS